jgi:hypothetical protein
MLQIRLFSWPVIYRLPMEQNLAQQLGRSFRQMGNHGVLQPARLGKGSSSRRADPRVEPTGDAYRAGKH